MKTKTKNIFRTLVGLLMIAFFSFFLILPGTASAQPLVPCGLNGAADCTLCHLVIGFNNIYNYLLYVVLFPATVTVIVIAGIMYMVSSGNKGLLDTAKKTLIYALSAIIVALTAWLIINATLHALGYKNAGNWWTFTCDTTQSTGPVSPGGGTPPPGVGGTAPPPGPAGNCGGMKTSVPNQCVLVSGSLQSLLSCMSNQGAPGTITSISASNIGGDYNASYACCGNPSCIHATYSCHYGCGMADQGYSHAVDVGTGGWSDAQLCELATVAKGCGAGTIWGPKTMACGITYQSGHGTHLHISTGACGH